MPTRIPARRAIVVALVAALLSACGNSTSTDGSGSKVTLRLGYITRITHASALVAVDRGLFTKNLGPSATLAPQPFQQGIAEVTALLSDKLDAAYIGTNPAFNAWQKSHGTAINIVSGSARGGTSFVVKPGIKTAQDLRGKTVADPGSGRQPRHQLAKLAERQWPADQYTGRRGRVGQTHQARIGDPAGVRHQPDRRRRGVRALRRRTGQSRRSHVVAGSGNDHRIGCASRLPEGSP